MKLSVIDQSKIRNFCIIAHIDHGKSTLADRIIEQTGLLTSREMQSQGLDNMELERERGITIKAQTVRTVYKADDGEEYMFNLIDTPGHVDFSAEMERTLQVLDYAVLVVSGADGVQGHTETLWQLLKRYQVPVFLFINKMDQNGTDREALMEDIRKRLDENCLDFGMMHGGGISDAGRGRYLIGLVGKSGYVRRQGAGAISGKWFCGRCGYPQDDRGTESLSLLLWLCVKAPGCGGAA